MQLVEKLCTLSTAIHSNSQKEKEAKRKRNGRRRIFSLLNNDNNDNNDKENGLRNGNDLNETTRHFNLS